MERKYDLEERLLTHASDVIRLTDKMVQTKAGNHVSQQLIRACTSPLSNHGEAQAAESRSDFVHKMCLCLKELRESLRWIKLTIRIPLLKDLAEANRLLQETDALVRIFRSSVMTARQKTTESSTLNS